jgi:hypothetical protein
VEVFPAQAHLGPGVCGVRSFEMHNAPSSSGQLIWTLDRNQPFPKGADFMRRILLAVLAVFLLCVGTLRADPATLRKTDVPAQTITVMVGNNEQTISNAQRIRIIDAFGKEIKLEDLARINAGTRLELKGAGGKITEIQIVGTKF